MGLSTERKVFVGVLAVAGIALIVDQGFLGPSEASATPPAPPLPTDAEPAQPAEASATPIASSATMAQVLMERLGSMNGATPDQSLSSAFSLQELMESAEPLANNEVPQDMQVKPALPIIRPTAPDLPTLSAVMPSARGKGGALLNGKLVRAGEDGPNGFVLLEVRERSVILQREGRTYTVEMPMQSRP